MNLKTGLCAGFAAAVMMVAATAAEALTYDRLFVFGDSLSDQGNTHAASGGVEAAAPYFNGRYSNGPVWSDTVAAMAGRAPASLTVQVQGGLPLAAATGGINYAFGGAATNPTAGIYAVPSLIEQMGLFNQDVTNNGLAVGEDDLFVVWAGANNYLSQVASSTALMTQAEIAALVGYAPSDVMISATNAITAGAQRIVVPNLPAISRTPLAYYMDATNGNTVVSQNFQAVVDYHNTQLEQMISALAATYSALDVIYLDVESIMLDLAANPASAGLANVTDPCYIEAAGTVCSDAGSYMFWDAVHPTATVHSIIAQSMADAVDAAGVHDVPFAGSEVMFLVFAGGMMFARYRKS